MRYGTREQSKTTEAEMSEQELKPCPFCGGEAEFDFYDGSATIKCADMCEVFPCVDVFIPDRVAKQMRERAFKLWNARKCECDSICEELCREAKRGGGDD